MAFSTSPMLRKIVQGSLTLLGAAGSVAILSLVYTMWHDSREESAANGENRAALAFTKGRLTETTAENLKLKDEVAALQKRIDEARQELTTEQLNNRYDKRLLEESTTRQKQLETQVDQLRSSLAKSDPCAPLHAAIDGLERALQVPTYRLPHLNGMQRKQAEESLAKKYRSLDVCLSASR